MLQSGGKNMMVGVKLVYLMGEWCENDNTQNTDDITSIADY